MISTRTGLSALAPFGTDQVGLAAFVRCRRTLGPRVAGKRKRPAAGFAKSLAVLVLLALSVALQTPLPAHATLVGLTLEGDVISVDPALAGEFAVADRATFELLYDTAATDTNPSSSIGVYVDALISLSLEIGTYTATAGTGSFSVGDVPAFDQFLFSAFANFGSASSPTPLDGPPVNGLPISSLGLTLIDTDGTAVDGDALPVQFDTPGEFEIGEINLTFIQFSDLGTRDFVVTAQLDRVVATAVSVAEPAVAGVLAIGLFGLFAIRRRRSRSFSPPLLPTQAKRR